MISTMRPRASGLLLAAEELHHPFAYPEMPSPEDILRRLDRLPEESVESLVVDHRILTSDAIQSLTLERRRWLAEYVASEPRHLERLQHLLLMTNSWSRSRRMSAIEPRRLSLEHNRERR